MKVGETAFHKLLKRTVMSELLREGYVLYAEPTEAPIERLHWDSFRPDILGINSTKDEIRLVLVECETNPSKTRVLQKTWQMQQTFSLQTRLNERQAIRPLLIIPPLTLHRVNISAIRRFWEMWIISQRGDIIHKLPSIG